MIISEGCGEAKAISDFFIASGGNTGVREIFSHRGTRINTDKSDKFN